MKINLSKNDVFLIALASLFSATCFYFWFSYKSNFTSRNMQTIATLDNFASDVRWKIYGNFDWIKPDLGVGLVSGDQIYTGNEAMAVINFKKNDSKIVIHSNSLVTILENEDRLIMDIQKGSFDIEGKVDDSIQIKNKGIIQELPISPKSVTVEATKKGPVKVEPKIEVLPKIISPKNHAKFDINENIKLKLSGIFSGRAEISSDEAFSQIIRTYDFKDGLEVNDLDLKSAQKYYLRLQKANLISPVQSFEITEVKNIELISPLADENLILQRGNPLVFSWENPNSDTDVVKFYSADKLIKEISSIKGTASLYLSPSPEMSWEVSRLKDSVLVAQSKRIPFSFEFLGLKINSDLLKFDHVYKNPVNFKLPLLPNERIKITQMDALKEKVLNSFEVASGNVVLPEVGPGHHFLMIESLSYPAKEKSSLEVKAYADTVYFKGLRDKKNNSYIMIKKLEADKATGSLEVGYESGVELKKQLVNLTINGVSQPKYIKNVNKKNDRYFELELNSFGDYCLMAKYSETDLVEFFRDTHYCFNVTQKKYFQDLIGAKDQILNRDPLNKVETYNIFLPLNKNAKSYVVQIYSDQNLKNVVYTSKSETNIVNWKSQRAGIYYYRYKLVDKNGNESDFSDMAKLIFPISPFSDWSEKKP